MAYNCGKRGTVIIDKTGKIALWQEVPMREPRDVAVLRKQIESA